MDGLPSNIIEWIRFIVVVVAAGIVGNWFMYENKKNKAKGRAWYNAYLSVPGMIIVAAIVVIPLVIFLLKNQ